MEKDTTTFQREEMPAKFTARGRCPRGQALGKNPSLHLEPATIRIRSKERPVPYMDQLHQAASAHSSSRALVNEPSIPQLHYLSLFFGFLGTGGQHEPGQSPLGVMSQTHWPRRMRQHCQVAAGSWSRQGASSPPPAAALQEPSFL